MRVECLLAVPSPPCKTKRTDRRKLWQVHNFSKPEGPRVVWHAK